MELNLGEIKKDLKSSIKNKKCKIGVAIQFVEKLTEGQKRKNGDPLISHPLMVALKTSQMGLGTNAVCAALLHDVIEDYHDHPEYETYIEKEFGIDVLTMVKALTEINSNPSEKSKKSEIESAQKFLLATVPDLRVIMIKIADKLHNLMTVEGLSPERQKGYTEEVSKIYAPIAQYLGLWNIYLEIRDLILFKTDPKLYEEIKNYIDAESHNLQNKLDLIIEEIKIICELKNLKPKIYGRIKSISSIALKLQKYEEEGKFRKNRNKNRIEAIEDKLAIRIITQNEDECYTIIENLRKFFDEVEGSLDDYIRYPKKNGYRSLQINLIHPTEGIFETQIRTQEMHEYNEFGPASHIAYKLAAKREIDPTDKFDWIKMINVQKIKEKIDKNKPIPVKLFEDQVFILTPQKDVYQLPIGATPIDLAYELHSDIGDHCVGAIVNQKAEPLNYKLKTGDIVKILTSKSKKSVNKEWLKSTITEKARRYIKQASNKA
ncbi:bifunctional (p)ppGpp synthetase/guanosine-3',5'-bis(diphosphate) 3'-pyrophosphohydrolase [Candidatus Dojkabacteria bacterium]|nr:bifunctional (p)ppGpp synthetase/guanosine-3',5'-bis(diphosphate) 3'-pyrophosphohydrolase [Candidatus Dojkabacteria bacterium]